MAVQTEYYHGATKESPFYGKPKRLAEVALLEDKRVQKHELPAGWLVQTWDGWEGWTPRDWQPRLQGWKIHVSATPESAEKILEITSSICIDTKTAFKFLPTLSELFESSSKQMDRGSSGKFITIYPTSDESFGKLLESLGVALKGQKGPYILSDLRYINEAPVFVRYGAIIGLRMPDVDDEPVESIVDVRSMHLIADQRKPGFLLPDGITIPEVLRDSYETSQQSSSSRLDAFTSIEPLSFSNAGGVYRSQLPDGQVRILREARPHAGFDARNRCALQRQLAEEETLRDLVGVQGVQQILGSFTAWEHRYLELEYAEGVTLTTWMVRNTNLQESDPEEYARRVVPIVAQIIRAIEDIHQRGWAFGDLHPGNVLVSDDAEVTLVDLEDATRLDSKREVGFRVFEYCADESADAEQADWFAVARCIMMLFCADFETEAISPEYWERCRDDLRGTYGEVPANQLELVESRYSKTIQPVTACRYTVNTRQELLCPEEAVTRLMTGIEWSRQFGENDSFPGDIKNIKNYSHEVFTTGRAGVVFAQNRIGVSPKKRDINCLCEVASKWSIQESPGLLDGLAGIALTLSEVGKHRDALNAIDKALDCSLARRRLDIAGGQAGVIMAAFEIAKAAEDSKLLSRVMKAYERLHRTIDVDSSSAKKDLSRRRGYFWGLTGVALTDLVSYTITKEDEILDRAKKRIREELDACVLVPESGDLMIKDEQNNRYLPYLEWGSAGLFLIGTAWEQLAGDALITEEERVGILKSCSAKFYIYPTLDHGRSGILAALTAGDGQYRTQAVRQLGFLLKSLLGYEEHALVPGDGLIRLSADMGTGASGVALAIHAHCSNQPYSILPVSMQTANILNHKYAKMPSKLGSVSIHDENVAIGAEPKARNPV